MELRDSGIVTLESGAKLETESVMVKAPTFENLEVEIEYVSGNKTPDFSFSTNELKVDILTAPNLIKFTSLDKLAKITRDIKDLEVQIWDCNYNKGICDLHNLETGMLS